MAKKRNGNNKTLMPNGKSQSGQKTLVINRGLFRPGVNAGTIEKLSLSMMYGLDHDRKTPAIANAFAANARNVLKEREQALKYGKRPTIIDVSPNGK